jgi:YVTN family beta-propeller protein
VVVDGGGLVWVANWRDGTVTVVDPGANRVQETLPASEVGTLHLGFRPTAVAAEQGAVWVTLTA